MQGVGPEDEPRTRKHWNGATEGSEVKRAAWSAGVVRAEGLQTVCYDHFERVQAEGLQGIYCIEKSEDIDRPRI